MESLKYFPVAVQQLLAVARDETVRALPLSFTLAKR